MMHPPGSLPGIRSLAIIPATKPTKIQLRIFILGLFSLLEGWILHQVEVAI
jgi:hypothetical protein